MPGPPATADPAAAEVPDDPAPPSPLVRLRTSLVGGWRGTALAIVVVALAVALPLPTLFRRQGPPMEEGFMLVFPERVLAGDVPNRDFLHLYGPASLWSLAAWFKVVGTSLATERLYGLLQHLVIIFALVRLALPWGRRVATVCGLLGVLLVITPIGLAALAWNGGVALGLVGLSIALLGAERAETGAPGARLRLGLGGVVLGLALLWRPDLVVAIGIAGIALLWRRWGRATVVPLVGGVLVGVAPILVHVAMAGLGNVVEGMFLQPVFDLRGGRHLPIPPSWDRSDSVLQALATLDADWPVPMVDPPAQVTLWFFALPVAALVLLVTGVVAVRRDPLALRSRILVVVGAFGVGLLPQALQRPDTTHLAWVSCVSLVFLPVAVVQWGEWWAARRPGRHLRGPARLALAVLPLVVVVLVIPVYTARTWIDLTRQTVTGDVEGWPVRHGDRVFYVGASDIADSAQSVADDLAARIQPGDRLFVGTADLRKTPYSDAYFYFLFPGATPATYYIEMDPGIANAEDSGLADEVARADFLVLSHVWDPWDEPNDSRLFGSDAPNQVVDDQFCPLGDESDYYVLYERC